MILMMTTPESLTSLEVVLMIIVNKVKKLLKLAQPVRDAQDG